MDHSRSERTSIAAETSRVPSSERASSTSDFKKFRARLADRRFVGHRPDDHARAILVARDHIAQLLLRVRQGLRVRPLDRPINRDLLPNQDAHFVGQPRHVLVVRVVREPDKIAAQFLRPAEQ